MFNKINSKIISRLVCWTKIKDNHIIFESDEHHVYDNSYSLFKYLSKYKKLKLYYVIYRKEQYKECFAKGLKKKQIVFISNKVNKHNFKNFVYILRIKKILKSCSLIFISYRNFYNEFKININKEQKVINMRHGQFPVKEVADYYRSLCAEKKNTFFRVGSTESLKLLSKAQKDLPCQWFACGMPRNDDNYDDKIENLSMLIGKKFDPSTDKLILCMTTFKGDSKRDYFSTQFPIKINPTNLSVLNQYLREKNTYLLIKAHHDNIIDARSREFVNYSNILLKSSIDFDDAKVFSSQLFKYSSALITDYSSVLFDFLLFDKPVGFALGDFNYYQTIMKFSIPYSAVICGPVFEDFSGMFSFIKSVLNNNDEYKEKRKEVNLLFNGSDYNICNSKKIAELFINKKYLC